MKTENFFETEIDHYREKAKEAPQRYLPKLGMLLNGYGVFQREKKALKKAQKYHQAALLVYQQLSETKEHLPSLAATLNHLSFTLQERRQDEIAITYAEDVLKICRELAEEDQDVYLVDVAISLNNLANLQSYLNNTEQAQQSYLEALSIYKTFVEKKSKEYLPDLAALLVNLAIFSDEQKQTNQAILYFEEALQIYKELIPSNTKRHLKEVGTILDDMISIQTDREQFGKVLKLMKENVAFLQEGATNDSQYLPYQASLLYNIGIVESADEKNEKGYQYFIDAIHTYIVIAKKEKEYFLKDIARALRELIFLAKKEGYSDEITLPGAFFDQYKFDHQKHPAVFLSYLATTLNSLGEYQYGKEAYTPAICCYKESIHILTFIEPENKSVVFEKAKVLFRLGRTYQDISLNSSAENCYINVLEIYSTLPETDLLRIETSSNISNNRALLKMQSNDFQEAEVLFLKALKGYRKLSTETKVERRLNIIISLNNLSDLKTATIELTKAKAYLEEVIAIYWKLERENPNEYLEQLYDAYIKLGTIEKSNEDYDEASKAYNRALDIAKKLFEQTSPAYQDRLSSITTLLATIKGKK